MNLPPPYPHILRLIREVLELLFTLALIATVIITVTLLVCLFYARWSFNRECEGKLLVYYALSVVRGYV